MISPRKKDTALYKSVEFEKEFSDQYELSRQLDNQKNSVTIPFCSRLGLTNWKLIISVEYLIKVINSVFIGRTNDRSLLLNIG